MCIAIRLADTATWTAANGRPPSSTDNERASVRRPLARLRSESAAKADSRARQAAPVTYFDEQDQRLADWMNAAQTGDQAAYEHVLQASIPFIKMVARRQGVPADLIDDVVQETLLTVHRIRKTYDSSRPFMAWLRTIAQRRAIDAMRSQGRASMREVHEPLALEKHADPAANPEEQAYQIECKSLVGIAVAALPAKQREAVEQLTLNERSLAEAAVATGLTPGALKVNLHRALRTLRAHVREGLTTSAHAFANIEHAFVNSKV